MNSPQLEHPHSDMLTERVYKYELPSLGAGAATIKIGRCGYYKR